MNIQNILNDKSFQVGFTAFLVFLVIAFPPLFKMVDSVLAKVLGKRIGSNYYSVLLLHAIFVGILTFLFTSYILKPVYKMLTTHDVAKSSDKKSSDKKSSNKKSSDKKTLEKFSVGGNLTCGGGK